MRWRRVITGKEISGAAVHESKREAEARTRRDEQREVEECRLQSIHDDEEDTSDGRPTF